MNCTRCDGTGFLNIFQVPNDVFDKGTESVLEWIKNNENHDVTICDCCGNGEEWYGEPGEHYGSNDPIGNDGPYGYNGGLCECH